MARFHPIRRRSRAHLAVVLGLACLLAAPVRAADKCKAQIDAKTGAVAISAADVGPNPRWGAAPGETTQPFANEADCFEKGKLSRCALGEAGTLAEKTPPALCSICVGDDGPGDACCVSHIRGCSPGLRVGDDSFPKGDPRVQDLRQVPYAEQAGTADVAGAALEAESAYSLEGVELDRFVLRENIRRHGPYSARRGDAAGTTSTRMVSTSNSLCFLSEVSMEDIESFGEWAECEIYASGGYWYLRARLGDTNDSNAWCQSRCISW